MCCVCVRCWLCFVSLRLYDLLSYRYVVSVLVVELCVVSCLRCVCFFVLCLMLVDCRRGLFLFDRCLWLVGCRVFFGVGCLLSVVCCVSCVVVVCWAL